MNKKITVNGFTFSVVPTIADNNCYRLEYDNVVVIDDSACEDFYGDINEVVTKENGNIDVKELSWKQIIALLNMWNTNDAKRENASFTEMVRRCYKPRTWNENANIIYLHKDNLRTTIVPHACYYLDDAEENIIFDLLKKQLSKDDKKEK